MRTKKSKQLFAITLEYENGVTRVVKIRAATRSVAEARALKFNPSAKRVKYDV